MEAEAEAVDAALKSTASASLLSTLRGNRGKEEHLTSFSGSLIDSFPSFPALPTRYEGEESALVNDVFFIRSQFLGSSAWMSLQNLRTSPGWVSFIIDS